MKAYRYSAGIVALSLAVAVLPALARAEGTDSGGGDGAQGTMTVTATGPVNVTASTSLHVMLPPEETRESNQESSHEGMNATSSAHLEEVLRMREAHLASSTEELQGDATSSVAREDALAHFAAQFGFTLESSTPPVANLDELKQAISQRKHELDLEAESTATSTRPILEEANTVRLAAHALVASQDLVGSTTGKTISQLAQEVNDSLATTTAVEAQIQSRGFWTGFFWGGDTQAADILKEEVAANQNRIDTLTNLLNEASTTADVKATLTAQIQVMQQEQARLKGLADVQAKAWGLFSWRF